MGHPRRIVDYTLKKDSKLIRMVRNHPCLYDKNHNFYKDDKIKDSTWQQIADYLNEKVDWCKNRWKYLIQRYICEYKVLHKEYVWLLFPQIDWFLEPYINWSSENINHERGV